MAKFTQASGRIGPDPQMEPELCGVLVSHIEAHRASDGTEMIEVRCNRPRNHGQRSIKGTDGTEQHWFHGGGTFISDCELVHDLSSHQ